MRRFKIHKKQLHIIKINGFDFKRLIHGFNQPIHSFYVQMINSLNSISISPYV